MTKRTVRHPDAYPAATIPVRRTRLGYNDGSDAAAGVDVKVHSVTLEFISLADLIAAGVAIQS